MPSDKSSVHGHVDSFKRLLDTFISELEELEPTGLPLGPDNTDPECHRVRAFVNNIAEHVLKRDKASLMTPHGGALSELATHYQEWNQAPRGADGEEGRRTCIAEMRRARRRMPQRYSWGGPDRPVADADLDFLTQLRRYFHSLGEVARPEISARIEIVYRRDEKIFIRKEMRIERLASGEPMAFPRTYRQALR
jgi:hypothetical protein